MELSSFFLPVHPIEHILHQWVITNSLKTRVSRTMTEPIPTSSVTCKAHTHTQYTHPTYMYICPIWIYHTFHIKITCTCYTYTSYTLISHTHTYRLHTPCCMNTPQTPFTLHKHVIYIPHTLYNILYTLTAQIPAHTLHTDTIYICTTHTTYTPHTYTHI